MAIDMFIKIDGIQGESTDSKHKNEIEVLSYNHGVSQMASMTRSSTGSGTAERVSHQEFVFSKEMDKSTPVFNKFVCVGDHIPTIHFYCRRAKGDSPVDFMTYELKDTVITSYSVSGGSGVPTETISLNYGEIKWTYVETDDSDATKGNVEHGWSIIDNKLL